MKPIHVNDRLPNNNEYVLAHLTKDNWGDSDDPNGNRYWVVVKFTRGLSKDERNLMKECDRKRSFRSGDEWGNNQRPYVWSAFGPSTFFGQEVDYWVHLPKL